MTEAEIDELVRLEAFGTLAQAARSSLRWAALWKRLAKHRLRVLRPWRAQRRLVELQGQHIERLRAVVTVFREHEGRPPYAEAVLQRLDDDDDVFSPTAWSRAWKRLARAKGRRMSGAISVVSMQAARCREQAALIQANAGREQMLRLALRAIIEGEHVPECEVGAHNATVREADQLPSYACDCPREWARRALEGP